MILSFAERGNTCCTADRAILLVGPAELYSRDMWMGFQVNTAPVAHGRELFKSHSSCLWPRPPLCKGEEFSFGPDNHG